MNIEILCVYVCTYIKDNNEYRKYYVCMYVNAFVQY